MRRFLYILWVILRHRPDTWVNAERLPWWLRAVIRGGPWRLMPSVQGERGVLIRSTLEQLGPIFIKFGQLLSTRRDLIPEDIADELEHLQDRVPPFDPEQAVALVEKSLGAPVEQLFAQFDRQPMASASIAQVHGAELHTGRQVVVKVLRPDIKPVIEQDLKLMQRLAVWVERYFPEGRRLRPQEVVGEYRHTIMDELNLQHEGANTAQLRRNFAQSPLLYVPEVFWDYTRENVLTMERVYGLPVTDVAALKAQGTDMKKLAERGVEIFFTQVFRDSFFHADMHPGNIFVSKDNPASPQYIAIDCAIIGTLSDFDQYYLARNLLAIFQRNYREVAELHVECGWVPAHTRAHEFEAAIRSVCEPIFEKPLGEISFGQVLLQLFRTARRYDMEVQPSLVLLQKTLLHIEGLGRQLYPELDLWNTAMPFLEKWLRDRYSPQTVLKKVGDRLPGLLEQLPNLPERFLENGRWETTPPVPARPPQEPEAPTKNGRRQRLGLAALLTAFAAGIAHPAIWPSLQALPLPSWILLGCAVIILTR